MVSHAFCPYYFQEESMSAREIPSITDDYVADYPSVVERFFLRYYYIKPENPKEAYLVMFHSNRVGLIGLASMHPAFREGIKSISFVIGGTNRPVNVLKGKGKKGGLPLQHDSTLAILTTNADVQYKIPSCVNGKLIEINTKLLEHPDLLTKEGYGYIAIVLPKLEKFEELKLGLFSQEHFEKKFIENKKMME